MTDVSLPQTMIFGHVWQSVALAAVLAGVLILGKRMRGSTRYGLATAAFAASLLLPLAAFIPGETIVASLLKQLNAPVMLASTAPAEVVAPLAPAAPATPVAFAAPADPLLTPVSFERDATSLGLGVVAPVVKAEPPAPLFTLPVINLPDLMLPLLAIWAAGAAFLLFRTGRDLLAVERLVARAKPADLPDALEHRMKGVRVVVSLEAPGPMAAGLFRPAIVLPESIALASPGMAGLLEHEHAHIRRRDMLAALGQRIVIALLWWSPALHWMSRRIDEEREVACDEAAVDRTGDAKAFARSLTKQAENQLWVRAPKLAVGAIGPRSHFGRRVKRLIEIAKTGGHPSKYSGRLAFAGLALCVAVAAMITPRFTAEAQSPNGQHGKGAVDLTSPEARDQARAAGELDGGSDHSFNFTFDGDEDFAALGKDISELMNTIMPEIEQALSQLTPELQGELSALSAEMSALGVDVSSMVSQEVLREMPAIMEQVRQSLEEAGIDPDNIDGWKGFSGFDAEEVRQAMEDAREELKHALGPEMQAEIRRSLAEAREEIASHRGEIAEAMRESHNGLAIAREALAAAKAEIDAARARGDFNPDKIKFDFDLNNLSNIHGPGRHNSPAYKLFSAAEDCETAEVNRLIVEEKADVNAIFPGEGSPLMAAAEESCIDAARTLINAGADVNKGFPGQGTPLSIAASNGAMQVAQLLVNRKADVNASMPGEDTPLVEAAAEGDFAMVKFLVESGANVNKVSRVGSNRTPLQAALRHGNDEIATYLRSKGATEGQR